MHGTIRFSNKNCLTCVVMQRNKVGIFKKRMLHAVGILKLNSKLCLFFKNNVKNTHTKEKKQKLKVYYIDLNPYST